MGPLTFELFEATGDDSIYADSLSRRGEGVNDIAFEVADPEAERTRLAAQGAETLRRSEDGGCLYVDTRAEGNIMVRLVQG